MNKDGAAWSNHGQTIKLYQSGAAKYTLSTTGTAAAGDAIVNGTYDVWATNKAGTLVDTGVDVTISNNNQSATVDYYTLRLNKGAGIASVSGAGVYLSGETASIGATCSGGYHWSNWSGDSASTSVSATVTVNGAKTCTANAVANNVAINVNKDDAAWSNHGQTIKLYQNGAAKYTLTNSGTAAAETIVVNGTYDIWASNKAGALVDTGVDVTVSDNNATASIHYYSLTLNKGTGITTVTGAGTYLSGETASIGATCSAGYHWSNWSGDSASTSVSATVAMDGAKTCTANAEANTYKIIFDGNGQSGGSMTALDMVYGAAKELPHNGFVLAEHRFLGWATSKARADAGTVDYADAQSVNNLTVEHQATIYLYATWQKHVYRDDFDTTCDNDGCTHVRPEPSLDDKVVLTIELEEGVWLNSSEPLRFIGVTDGVFTGLPVPTRVGYRFNRWILFGAGEHSAGGQYVFGEQNGKLIASWISTSPDDYTWAEISILSQQGKGDEYFSIGDTKTFMLGGIEVVMEIVAFDKDIKEDGTRAGITWISRNIVAQEPMNTAGTNSGGWEASTQRDSLQTDFLNSIPDYIRSVIVPVQKSYYDVTSGVTKVCLDSAWIPSYREVFGGASCEQQGATYDEFFGSAANRVKEYSGSAASWALRSADPNHSNSFFTVASDGSVSYTNAGSPAGIVLGFCTGIRVNTLTIDPNGGSWNGSTDIQVFDGVTGYVKENIAAPEKDNCFFIGWKVSGSGSYSDADRTFTFGEGNGTLTAVWYEPA